MKWIITFKMIFQLLDGPVGKSQQLASGDELLEVKENNIEKVIVWDL